jgi:hypothetical protein
MPKGMQAIFTKNISGANFYTFNNIPQTYTDLKIVVSARTATGTEAAQGIYLQPMTDGSLLYSGTTLRNLSNSASSYRTSGNNAWLEFDINSSNNTSNNYAIVEVYIPNYTSNVFKQVIGDVAKEDNSSSGFTYNILRANLFRSNGPITAIQLGTNISAPNFAAESTVTIYGISK